MRGQGARFAVATAAAVIFTAIVPVGGGAHDPEHALPKPSGSPAALVPIPAPAKVFGFNDNSFLNQRRLLSPEQVAARAWPAGAGVVRFEVAWDDVEPFRDRWDEDEWERYQAIDRALYRQGIRPLVVLGRTPGWARDPGTPQSCSSEVGCEYPPTLEELDHWAEFAAEVALRFHNPIIETWNEPNLALFFRPAPNAARYARMHNAAYDAVKEERPRTPVLIGGSAALPATTTENGAVTGVGHRQFLTRIYPTVKGNFDGIGLHPYAAHPTLLGRKSTIAHALHDARSVQKRFKDRGNDLWITETGFSTSGPEAVTEAGQAKGLLGVYRLLMTSADVRGVIFHTLFDQTDASPQSRAYGFGAVHSEEPLDFKEAYCALNGRSRRPLAVGCTRQRDGKAPGAKSAAEIRRTCVNWLKRGKQYKAARGADRVTLVDACVLDLMTIRAAGRKRLDRLRRQAATRARAQGGDFAKARGRAGIVLARRAVTRLARHGYL